MKPPRVLCSAPMGLPGLVGRPVASPLTRAIAVSIAIMSASAAGGCGDVNAALERLSEARRLSADLYVQFVKAADAGNRAVMADTDEASLTFAHEAEQATQAAQADVTALKPILQTLGYSNETRLLEEFDGRFTKYRALDRTILDLAVENTNLKAQRLSFGSGQEAAEAFRRSLEAVQPLATSDEWRVRALVASAVASVREIQVLQAPHIAEPDDAAMARIEKQIAAEEAAARSALTKLASMPSRRRGPTGGRDGRAGSSSSASTVKSSVSPTETPTSVPWRCRWTRNGRSPPSARRACGPFRTPWPSADTPPSDRRRGRLMKPTQCGAVSRVSGYRDCRDEAARGVSHRVLQDSERSWTASACRSTADLQSVPHRSAEEHDGSPIHRRLVMLGGVGALFVYRSSGCSNSCRGSFLAYQTTAMTPDLAFNTAISFTTTTTWQAYGGETR